MVAEAKRYQTCCAAAAEGIEDGAGHGVATVSAIRPPPHRAGCWKRAVVRFTRRPAGTHIGQHSPAAGLRISGPPFSLVVDGNHGGFEYHAPPRCATLGTTSAFADSRLDTGLDQRGRIGGEMRLRIRL